MCSIAIKIPDEVLYDTKMTKDEANAFAKKATALMLYLKNQFLNLTIQQYILQQLYQIDLKLETMYL